MMPPVCDYLQDSNMPGRCACKLIVSCSIKCFWYFLGCSASKGPQWVLLQYLFKSTFTTMLSKTLQKGSQGNCLYHFNLFFFSIFFFFFFFLFSLFTYKQLTKTFSLQMITLSTQTKLKKSEKQDIITIQC